MGDTLLFVHGTGVRKEGYEATMRKLRAGLDKAGLTRVVVEGVLWGDTLGTDVSESDMDSVLPPAEARGLYDAGDWEAALWSDLMSDPLTELRLASLGQPQGQNPNDAPFLPGQAATAIDLDTKFARLRQTLTDPLPGGVRAADIRGAADWVQAQQTTRDAAARCPSTEEAYLVQATARAIVAKTLVDSRREPGSGPAALYVLSERRELVRVVSSALTPDTMAILGWLFDRVKDFAEAKATAVGRSRRRGLMNLVSPGVGDILLYQRRSQGILKDIEEKIVKLSLTDGKLVVLGHSLGGIMLVDLLSRPRPDGKLRIDKLITVGSQSPILFKFDALETMRPKNLLPAGSPYTPWLNVYDRNDFLSFCAARAFPGVNHGIEDFPVDCGVPFPEAHSAYFHLDTFYKKVAEIWPKP